MLTLHENFAGRLLHKLVDALHLYPRWFFYLQVVLFAVCAWFTATRLDVNTSRTELVSARNRHQRNYLAFRREFRMRDSIVAIVESTDQEKNRAFIERLAARLRREPDLFKGI